MKNGIHGLSNNTIHNIDNAYNVYSYSSHKLINL